MPNYPITGTKVVSPYPVQLTPGERRLIFALQRNFTPENILADCYFPRPERRIEQVKVVSDADLVQIDCLALSPYGLFVFESKDYGGWVYGRGNQRSWTQVLNFGREKHQFYNPVLQNQAHIDALLPILPTNFPVYSMIVFGRDATLKAIADLPTGCIVCTQDAIRSSLAKLQNQEAHSEAEVIEVHQLLEQARINPTHITRAQHITEVGPHKTT